LFERLHWTHRKWQYRQERKKGRNAGLIVALGDLLLTACSSGRVPASAPILGIPDIRVVAAVATVAAIAAIAAVLNIPDIRVVSAVAAVAAIFNIPDIRVVSAVPAGFVGGCVRWRPGGGGRGC
jgi:hypothetical protein